MSTFKKVLYIYIYYIIYTRHIS